MAVFSGFEASCHNMKRMYLEKWWENQGSTTWNAEQWGFCALFQKQVKGQNATTAHYECHLIPLYELQTTTLRKGEASPQEDETRKLGVRGLSLGITKIPGLRNKWHFNLPPRSRIKSIWHTGSKYAA
jgi:hypothetical protein